MGLFLESLFWSPVFPNLFLLQNRPPLRFIGLGSFNQSQLFCTRSGQLSFLMGQNQGSFRSLWLSTCSICKIQPSFFSYIPGQIRQCGKPPQSSFLNRVMQKQIFSRCHHPWVEQSQKNLASLARWVDTLWKECLGPGVQMFSRCFECELPSWSQNPNHFDCSVHPSSALMTG